MAVSKSAIKRIRTSKEANIRNRMRTSVMKTAEKKFRAAVAAGDKENAIKFHRECCSSVDNAAKLGTIHANKAGNKKSQFDKLLNTLDK